MTDASTAGGWYPDPADSEHSLRFFDGAAWTDQTRPRQQTPAPPLVAPTAAAAAPVVSAGGWYPDPADPERSLRFFDGAAWTDQTRPGQQALASPGPVAQPGFDGPPGGFSDPQPWHDSPEPTVTPVSVLGPGGYAAPAAPPFAQGGYHDDPYSPAAAPAQGGYAQGGFNPGGYSTGPAHPLPPSSAGPGGVAGRLGALGPLGANKRLIAVVAVVAVVAVLVVAGMGGAARNNGTTWFSKAAPSSWTSGTIKSVPSGMTLLHAWAVPGPKYGDSHPLVAVLEVTTAVPAGTSAASALSEVAQAAKAQGQNVQTITLDDGAPALMERVSAPDPASGIPVTAYQVLALDGSHVYMVQFQTATANYAAEAPSAISVINSFKGTK